MALAQWQSAAGPYWMYVCAAPFLGEAQLPERTAGRGAAARHLATLLTALSTDGRPASFVDLRLEATLPATPVLNEAGQIVVPVIQRWVTPHSVLPCHRLIGQLVAFGAMARRPARARGVVFLLDGERQGRMHSRANSRPPSGRAFDNRYSYRVCLLPPPGFLLRDGVERVQWLAPAGIAADLRPYAQQLSSCGLPPRLVPLELESCG